MGTIRRRYSKDDFLSGGGCGLVGSVSPDIVVKTAWAFEDLVSPERQRRSDEAIKGIQHETSIYRQLMRIDGPNWHPNFVQTLLFEPQAIFLQRVDDTLKTVGLRDSVPESLHFRWSKQIANAAS